MMACVSENASMQRRMVFAASFLPFEIPCYWNIVADFANQVVSSKSRVSPESAKVIVGNLQVLYKDVFSSDTDLAQQITRMEYSVTKQPLGIPLVPSQTNCLLCGGKLLLRGDKPSRMTLYTESIGSVPATHFHKFCHNSRKGCHFVQFYGYFKSDSGTMHCIQ